MLGIIIALFGGVAAAASLIVNFKPDSKNLIDKLTPYQGIIGLVLLGWGVYSLIQLIRVLLHGYFDLMSVLTVALMLVVGFLLSFGLLSQFVFSKSPAALEKGEALRAKLSGFQGILGLVLIGLSIWALIRIL
ncbi:hypothetical protein [Marinicella meishanensis]|uniref:hypothetical protein n=1 Tax=Marinicella meishanensis TaxID=2873263 RepID=UPI001CBC5C2B|nr:hypothetical protein [Marinicella sp. NBU2979]